MFTLNFAETGDKCGGRSAIDIRFGACNVTLKLLNRNMRFIKFPEFAGKIYRDELV
jgi:hypothetical protein